MAGWESRREGLGDGQRQKTRETPQDFRLLNASENSRANHVASGHHRIVVTFILFITY